MTDRLRCYPLPYLSYRLDRKALEKKAEICAKIERLMQVPPYRERQMSKDYLAQYAFAECYDKMIEFNNKDISKLKWDSFSDYEHSNREIKLMVAEASGMFGNTGPRMVFKLSRRTFEKSRADTFVLVAMNMPYVGLMGYMKREVMPKYIQSWSIAVSANSKDLLPMWSWKALEESRINGLWV